MASASYLSPFSFGSYRIVILVDIMPSGQPDFSTGALMTQERA